MGCSSTKNAVVEKKDDEPKKEEPKLDFFKAYKSFKKNIILYKNKENKPVSFKAYLISTKTIPKFLELIKKTEILDNLLVKDKEDYKENNIDTLEKYLKELLKDYKLENNIEIFYDYNKCVKLKNTNFIENEFIMVGDDFIDNMKANPKKKKEWKL